MLTEYNNFNPIHAANIVAGNLTCSENVAYDSTENTLRMSRQANVACSDNIAYTTVNTLERNSMEVTSTSHAAVYDEVSPKITERMD